MNKRPAPVAPAFACEFDALRARMRKCVRRARKDGRPHDGMFSLAGAWGHPTVFIGSRPRGIPLELSRKRLQAYMYVKRHQMKSGPDPF